MVSSTQRNTTDTSQNPLVAELILPPPTPVMMWPSGRFQHVGIVAFYPPTTLSKDNTGSGPIPFYTHLKTLNKVTHVSSQDLLIIHICHTR